MQYHSLGKFPVDIYYQNLLNIKCCCLLPFSPIISVTFFPVGNQYWLFREANLEPGYPQELMDYGRDIPYDKIETAIWWEPSGFTYFFKGDW